MKFLRFTSLGFILGFLITQFSFKASAHDDGWSTRTYEIAGFTKLHLEGGYRVYLIQGSQPSLKVKASDEDAFDYLKVDNDAESLRLSISKSRYNFDRLTLYITFTTLEELSIEGGVRLETNGYIDVGDLDIYVEGGAKLEIEMKANHVKAVGVGGVFFEFEGVAESLDAKMSGAGHLDASELKAKNVSFRIEGVGTGSVYATDELHADIEGVGKIKYRGNPKVYKNIDGIGVISGD
ncbi:MAG: DUF2807 domain-containing protein [Chlorobi bacterium]|nr:DUF2807 domain-containing protein [Chlorobiota bacterium]